jgi:hypothetical protein
MKFFYIDENTVSISLNETTSITDLNKILTVLLMQRDSGNNYWKFIYNESFSRKYTSERQRSCNTMFSINTIRKPL